VVHFGHFYEVIPQGYNVSMIKVSLLIQKVSRLFPIYRESRNPTRLIGYENSELVSEIVRKTIKRRGELVSGAPLQLSEMRSMIGLLNLKSDNLRVLDFGGGAGTHFDTFSSVFPNLIIEYYVVETPEMVNTAKKMRSPEGKLNFLTLEELEGVSKEFDLLLINSSLQYTTDPIEILKSLIKLKPKQIWMTRLPLNEESETLTISQISKLSDNGPGINSNYNNEKVEYVATIAPRASLESELSEEYKILAMFQEERNPFGGSHPYINAWGYLLALTDRL
jgi:putative methyltransferase (TIGR04325 family)